MTRTEEIVANMNRQYEATHVPRLGEVILRAERHGYVDEKRQAWKEAEQLGLVLELKRWLAD